MVGYDYKYQSLGSGFRGRKMEPFLAQVDPLPEGKSYRKNTHNGQEFDYIVEGVMELTLGEKIMVLKEGDSVYFDATKPHRMQALGGKPVKFLCVIM